MHTEEELDSLSSQPLNKLYCMANKNVKAKPSKQQLGWGIKNKNDNILNSKIHILVSWAEYYEDLYHTQGTPIDDTHE